MFPDHTHAVAVMRAIKMGKHVYCEKPLAHSIYEARQIMEAASKYKVQTQLGNQGHSSEQIRMMREWVWDVKNMRITNDEEANKYVNPPYREGWTL